MKLIKSTSNIILILNITFIILLYLAAYFWIELGLTDRENVYIGLIGVLIFGLTVGGFFAGIAEKKEKGRIALIGTIGNLILLILFLVLFAFITAEMI